MEEKARRHHLV